MFHCAASVKKEKKEKEKERKLTSERPETSSKSRCCFICNLNLWRPHHIGFDSHSPLSQSVATKNEEKTRKEEKKTDWYEGIWTSITDIKREREIFDRRNKKKKSG